MQQTVLHGVGSHYKIASVLEGLHCEKFLLVCGKSFLSLGLREDIAKCAVPYAVFSEFKPNPRYEDICNGVALFHREKCDCIVAVGGGSAIDVAKCIKLFAGMDATKHYLEQPYADSGIPLIAIPTTAGTGSESTHFAVIYYEGKKQSVAHESILPDFAILVPSVLKNLPLYQKKCTMLDALCQAIESWWSVRSCEESIRYSRQAIKTIVQYKDAYLIENADEAAEQIMLAANYAGRAINLTTTTAAHAMSYKLTSLYGLPHGHAVAICLPKLWRFMLTHLSQCNDPRGKDYLESRFLDIARALGAPDADTAISNFEQMLQEMEISAPAIVEDHFCDLTASVNATRLGNNPVGLTAEDLEQLYRIISKE